MFSYLKLSVTYSGGTIGFLGILKIASTIHNWYLTLTGVIKKSPLSHALGALLYISDDPIPSGATVRLFMLYAASNLVSCILA